MPSIRLTQVLDRLTLWGVRLLALLAACAFQPVLAQAVDPPGTVAWLGQTHGEVSFSPANTDTWAYALPNRPLTTGDQLWVERGGRAELHIGSAALRLGPQSELAFTSLDEGTMQWRLSQGSLQVHVRALFPDQRIEIDTPNLAFVPSRPGSYRIDVDPASRTTSVTNWSGEATVNGKSGFSEGVDDRTRATYSGADLNREDDALDPPADDLDRWAWALDDRESRSPSARFISREMTGYAALDDHGAWTSDPVYGPVWIPTTVTSDWAPYHYGHWAWIDPWGWTWVDDAPWGFAPFHYGRWAWLPARSHWAWVPGPVVVARPVYAPALVAFLSGSRGGTRWGLSLSSGAPGVAWLPLAPSEAYRPSYHASPRYVTRINQTIVVRETTVNTTNVYVNQQAPHAVAAVPSTVFVHGQHVRGSEWHLPVDLLRHAHFEHTAGIAPITQSRLGDAHLAPSHVMVNMPVIQTAAPSEHPTRHVVGQPMLPSPYPHADKEHERTPQMRQANRPANISGTERATVNVQPEGLPRSAADLSSVHDMHRHEVPRPPHPAVSTAVSRNYHPATVVKAPVPPSSLLAREKALQADRLVSQDRLAAKPSLHPHPPTAPNAPLPSQPTRSTPPPSSQAPQRDLAHGHHSQDQESDQHQY